METIERKSKRHSVKPPKWKNMYLHRNGKMYPSDEAFKSLDEARGEADDLVSEAYALGLEAFYLEAGPDRAVDIDSGRSCPGIHLRNFLFHIQMPV